MPFALTFHVKKKIHVKEYFKPSDLKKKTI